MRFKNTQKPLLGILLLSTLLIFSACGSSDNPDPDPQTTVGFCGDGNINPGEECDGTNFGALADCSLLDPDTQGVPSCNDQCQLDLSGCDALPGYASCAGGDMSNCLPGETSCLGGVVCAKPCTDVADCPPKPEGIGADVVCDEESSRCFLGCANDTDCPDGYGCSFGACIPLI